MRRTDRDVETLLWWAFLFAATAALCVPRPALPMEAPRSITCTVSPWDYDQVRVEAIGACGEVCGLRVKWVAYTEDASGKRTRWTSGRGVEAWLDVERDTPMYVEATVLDLNDRDADGQPAKLGQCGYHFTYDGGVHRAEKP